MTDAEKAAILAQLPTDPRELLIEEEQHQLTEDLTRIHNTLHPCWHGREGA